MKPKRTFTSKFKRQVIEELLSGTATRAQISRKYNLSAGLITHWKEQYEKGKFGNEPTNEAALKERAKEQPLSEAKEENDLRDHIERIALDFPRYGYRRIMHQLKREGVIVNHKRVLRVMRESSLLVVTKKKWVKTTDSNHSFQKSARVLRIKEP